MIKERITRKVTKMDEDCAAISSNLAENKAHLLLELVFSYVFETHSMKMVARVRELKTFSKVSSIIIFTKVFEETASKAST